MEEPVAHARLVDVARFRVAYLEVLVWAVTVRPVGELAVEREDIAHKGSAEFLDVALGALAAKETVISLVLAYSRFPFYMQKPRVKTRGAKGPRV